MASPEIVKLVIPSSTRLDAGGYGGIPEITREMVDAALAYGKLTDGATLYIQYKYKHKDDLFDNVWRWVYFNHCNKWFINEGWVAKGKTVFLLPQVALEEVMNESLCKPCNGTGFNSMEGKECAICNGSGRKRQSNRSIAKRLGIDNKNLSRGSEWCSRFKRTLNVYYGYEDQLLQAVKKL